VLEKISEAKDEARVVLRIASNSAWCLHGFPHLKKMSGNIMHRSIEPHELTKIDLARFHVVQVSDGTYTVVLWEASESPRFEASTLTIRLCDPLNPVRRKDVCERLQAHLVASRGARPR
jgi:hypothetical protein